MTAVETAHRISALLWIKSSHSDNAGGNCVEVAWRKSTYSDNEGGNCVEVAAATDAVHVRDSKDVTRPHLTVGRDSWAEFLQYATTV